MSQDKPTIRASSLPLLFACSNAVLNPDGLVVVNTENVPATNGTLLHAMCRRLVDTGTYDLDELRQRMEPEDYERAAKLFSNFLTVWVQASSYLTRPVTEWGFKVELPLVTLTGHIDLHHTDALRAFVIDYKTGRQHEDHFHQMAAYAYGVWDKVGRPDEYTVYVTAVYLEDNSVHPYEFSAQQLREWADELHAQLLSPRYTVGRKCAGCGLQDSCPAYLVYAANAVREFNPFDTRGWEELKPEERGVVIDRMYVLENAIKRAKDGLRNVVRKRGQLDIGNNTVMTLVDDTSARLNERALPILLTRLGRGTLDRLARLPYDEVMTAYAAKAAKGQKTRARNELAEELDAAGAVDRIVSTKMWKRPKGEKVLA